MHIVAGLGNPGARYHMTRHNVGFDTIDFLAVQYRLTHFRSRHKALVAEGMMQGKKVMLVKPQTYMNNSGESLAEILSWYKADPAKLIVIYDDADLDPGKLRIRQKGGPGTHNGMRSIISHLGAEDFPRVRIGIGKPGSEMDLADFVLSRFTPEERSLVNDAIERAALAVATMVCASVEAAMGKYNR
ncbi:MAG: aminoacyl-tRNA hydrolase [Clostridiaceae bacterium]|jgi:PTH1 family peptidyl-tRNA hydrolase|nr:aminoacyl-tRNA hydrolase [Clostridiaceae bacterium]